MPKLISVNFAIFWPFNKNKLLHMFFSISWGEIVNFPLYTCTSFSFLDYNASTSGLLAYYYTEIAVIENNAVHWGIKFKALQLILNSIQIRKIGEVN